MGFNFTPVDRIGVVLDGDTVGLVAACNAGVAHLQMTANTIRNLSSQIAQAQAGMNNPGTTIVNAGTVTVNAANAGTAALAGTTRQASALTSAWGGLARAAGAYYIAMQGMRVAGWFIEQQNQIEQAIVAFSVLTHSDQVGEALFDKVQGMAIQTAFELKDLTKATQQFLAAGMDEPKIMGTLGMLGDLAMGDTEKFARLSKAYTDVMNKGRLQGQEVRQFAENSVGVLRLISDYLGKDIPTVTAMVEDGAISFDILTAALQKATGPMGDYHNLMNRMADESIGGKLSQIWETFSANMGKIMVAFSGVTDFIFVKPLEGITGLTTVAAESAMSLSADFMHVGRAIKHDIDLLLEFLGLQNKEPAPEPQKDTPVLYHNQLRQEIKLSSEEWEKWVEAVDKGSKKAHDAAMQQATSITSGLENERKSLFERTDPEAAKAEQRATLQRLHEEATAQEASHRANMRIYQRELDAEKAKRLAARERGEKVGAWNSDGHDQRIATENMQAKAAHDRAAAMAEQLVMYDQLTTAVSELTAVEARQKAEKKATEAAERAANEQRQEGLRLTEEMMTETEAVLAKQAEIQALFDRGQISPETHARAMKKTREELEKIRMETSKPYIIEFKTQGVEGVLRGTAALSDMAIAVMNNNQNYGQIYRQRGGEAGFANRGLNSVWDRIEQNTRRQTNIQVQEVHLGGF